MAYIWAVVVIVSGGGVLIMGILFLRPTIDPLLVIGSVTAALAPTLAGVMAFMKSQETHLSVNSRLDGFIAANSKVARAEGQIQGATDEQRRQAAMTAAVAKHDETMSTGPYEKS